MSQYNDDDQSLIDLLCDLIAIKSVNPTFADGVGEAEAADFVEQYCSDLGLPVWRQEVLPNRENVVSELRVPDAAGTLLFEAHMDTVSLEPMGEAGIQPKIKDGRIYGRGACDTKGSLAAMMATLKHCAQHRDELRVNIMLLAAADEEFKFRGVLKFIDEKIPVDGAIVGEPTDLRVIVAHKGSVRFRITTNGRAAHSSRPEEGDNAIEQMTEVLVALREYWETQQPAPHPLVGPPTFTIAQIEGGTGVNTVPESCTIQVDRRIIPGESHEDFLEEIDGVLSELMDRKPSVKVERSAPSIATPTLGTPLDHPIVAAAQCACRSLNLSDEPLGVPYGSDASKLWAYGGVGSIVLGPGNIEQAHGAAEYVPIHELIAVRDLYIQAALNFGMKE